MSSSQVVEVSAPFKKSGSVTLDANGNGVITFDPDNAWQRWEVDSVVVSTNQNANATVVPIATVALNTVDPSTMSSGNMRGSSWSGNQDSFEGIMQVSPCDFLSVVFYAAAGQDGTKLAGVIAKAVVTGTRYTRRA